MDKVNRELDYQYSGYVSDATALSLCQRLGAEEIVFGQLDELDNGYILHVKMLDVETGSYALFKKYEISRSSKTEQLLHHAATIYKIPAMMSHTRTATNCAGSFWRPSQINPSLFARLVFDLPFSALEVTGG